MENKKLFPLDLTRKELGRSAVIGILGGYMCRQVSGYYYIVFIGAIGSILYVISFVCAIVWLYKLITRNYSYKDRFKTINKFSKLTVTFTVLYMLCEGLFLFLTSYVSSIPIEWTPRLLYGHKLLLYMFWFLPYELFEAFFFLIIALMISTIWVGVIAIKQTDKNKEKGKWIAILLTLLNVSLFIILSPVIIAFTL